MPIMEYLAGSVYDYPKYYDLIYGSDWKAELGFLQSCIDRYLDGKARRIFEPACGTGRLLVRLGRSGYQVSGLDLNSKAVAYCNRRLERYGLPATALTGDMADFRLPQQVDVGFNMINSFRHLLDPTAAVRHLQAMARALRRGGLYVLGLHLTPTRGEPMSEESWSARRGNLAATVRLWTTQRNRMKRHERCAMVYDIFTPTRHMRLTDEVVFRMYTWPQFRRLLASVPEFEIASVHDFSYDIDQRICVGATTEDSVFVLRKR
jgi:SAM-dependent methyltransferase